MPASDGSRDEAVAGAIETVAASPAFDTEWFAAQVGCSFPDRRSAIGYYVARAAVSEASPHPLFEARWAYPGGRWRRESLDPLSYFLGRLAAGEHKSPHPLLDSGVQLLALADDTVVDVPVGESLRYADLRTAALAACHPRSSAGPGAEDSHLSTRPPEVAVVVPVFPGLPRAWWWLRQTWRGLDMHDGQIELLLVADHPAEVRTARVAALTLPGVRVVRGPRDSVRELEGPELDWLLAAGRAATAARVVVLVDPRLNVPPAEDRVARWVIDLAAALDGQALEDQALDDQALDDRPADSVAVPLLVERDQTVVAAGATYDADGTARPLLTGATPDDAVRMVRLAGPEVPAAWGAFRAELGPVSGSPENWPRVGGSLAPGRRVVLAPGVRVVVPERISDAAPPGTSYEIPSIARSWYDVRERTEELWAAAGYGPDGRPAPTVTEGRPALRWAIDTAAPLAPRGRRWGDDIFARSLASALEQLGQRVTVDHPETRGRANRAYDDVVLTLRGLERVPVDRSGTDALRLLWVISHPDEVTAEECAEHDLVFAAGTAWAADRSRAWATPIRTLLQCTDPTRFHPGVAQPDTGPDLVAVLNARGGTRAVVEHALAAGLPLTLYGDGWAGLVPPEVVAGVRVPNAELGALYGSAGVVLADHWEDMRRLGFVSNRVFDVLACGGRLWVDDVAGLDDVLSPLVDGLDTTLVPRVGSTTERSVGSTTEKRVGSTTEKRVGATTERSVGSTTEKRVGSTTESLVRTWRSAADFAPYNTASLRAGFPDLSTRLAIAERVVAEHSFAARARALLDAVLERRTE